MAKATEGNMLSCQSGSWKDNVKADLSKNGSAQIGSHLTWMWGFIHDVDLCQNFMHVPFSEPFKVSALNVTANISRESGIIAGTVATVTKSINRYGFEVAGDHDTHCSVGNIYWNAIGY